MGDPLDEEMPGDSRQSDMGTQRLIHEAVVDGLGDGHRDRDALFSSDQ